MLHELKIYPMHFNDILKNNKNFEVRKDDRLYEVGDYLYLREYLPADEYTGKEILAKVLKSLFLCIHQQANTQEKRF